MESANKKEKEIEFALEGARSYLPTGMFDSLPKEAQVLLVQLFVQIDTVDRVRPQLEAINEKVKFLSESFQIDGVGPQLEAINEKVKVLSESFQKKEKEV